MPSSSSPSPSSSSSSSSSSFIPRFLKPIILRPSRCLLCLFCRCPMPEAEAGGGTEEKRASGRAAIHPHPDDHHPPLRHPSRMNSLSEPLPALHPLHYYPSSAAHLPKSRAASVGRKPSAVAESISGWMRRKMSLKRWKDEEEDEEEEEEGGRARDPVEPGELIGLEAASRAETFDTLLRWALLQVSVDTMAITALPLDCWLKERLKNWVQLSGHQGTIVPASNHTLWKRQPQGSQTEARAYAKIMEDPALRGITPKFYKEIAHKQETFIEIQDLLAQFPDPARRALMDIKLGTRTFLEAEVTNAARREDLYRKMVELAPDEPSAEERRDGRVTKLRYMQFRERESSSATLGFRIEAAQMPGGRLQKNFKKVRSRQKCRETLMAFMGEGEGGGGDAEGAERRRGQLVGRLRHIRGAVERSQFFRRHEVVGSSVLIIYDHQKLGAWLIDFAKSNEVESDKLVNHRDTWEMGNHEDGWLVGMDNLIGVLEGDGEEGEHEGKEEEAEDQKRRKERNMERDQQGKKWTEKYKNPEK